MQENLIDAYLEKQQELTAVEKFALQHDFQQLSQGQSLYQELIPKNTPGPGQQYAFAVNLDQCTGCKACVSACHNENGLEKDETWRSVGLIHGGSTQQPVMQHVTTACHHCLDPACLNGCPVNAYEKDKATGIVKHLKDQCIGCQYCTFTCAYDVPKYNKKKGIVHKCDMCISRLDVGEAPACVRACPNGAIRITLVDVETVKKNPTEFVNIPDAPDSRYTLPTTRYETKRNFPANMVSVDSYTLKPGHSHAPLIVMLVLTQLSVGAFGAELFLRNYVNDHLTQLLTPLSILVAFGVGLLALGASIFHLGRPLYAFRAVIGLKRSWLSREIVAFVIFAILAAIYALCTWTDSMDKMTFTGKMSGRQMMDVLSFTTALFGGLGVFCSAMVYKVTQRSFWNNSSTFIKFFLTTAILGSATILFTSFLVPRVYADNTVSSIMQSFGNIFCVSLMVMTAVKLILEASIFFHLRERELTSLKKTALLMTVQLKSITDWRFICGLLGGIVLPFLLLISNEQMGMQAILRMSTLIFFICLAGEFLERHLFFRAVVPLKMPGGKIN